MTNPFYEQSWFTILLATIMGFAAFIGRDTWTRRAIRKLKAKDTSLIRGMKSITVLYQAMEQIKDLTPAKRVLLLEVGNSGSPPKPGEKIYARAIEVKMEDETDRLPILSNYEKVLIDDSYLSMVIQAKESGEPYIIDVETHKDCLLKRIYEQENVKYSEVHHLYSDHGKWKQFIVSISTNEEGEKFDNTQYRAIISNNVHRMRQTFELIR